MRYVPQILALLLSCALAPCAFAQPVLGNGNQNSGPAPSSPAQGLIQKITPQAMATLISQTPINNQHIQTSIKSTGANTFVVVAPMWGPNIYSGVSMERCEKDGSGCHWLDYFANFGAQSTVNANWMNAFNRHFLGGRAYTMQNGQLIIEQDVSLWPGVTPTEIAWYLVFFKNLVDSAAKYKGQ